MTVLSDAVDSYIAASESNLALALTILCNHYSDNDRKSPSMLQRCATFTILTTEMSERLLRSSPVIILPSLVHSSSKKLTRFLLCFQSTAKYLRRISVSYCCYLCSKLCLRDISETFEPAAYPVADAAVPIKLLDHSNPVAFVATLAVPKTQASFAYPECSVTGISSTSNSHSLRWTPNTFLLIAWIVHM